MDQPMTPQTACELASKLWGKPLLLKRHETISDRTNVCTPHGEFRFEANFNIEWGDVDQWPPKEPERKWRDARMPDDWGKPARFQDDCDGEVWDEGNVAGYCTMDGTWVDHFGIHWDKCQVEDIPAQDKTPPEPIPVEVDFPNRENDAKQESARINPVEPTDEDVVMACKHRWGEHYDRWQEYRTSARLWLRAWQQVVIDKARGDA